MIELKELTLGYGQRTLLKTVNARITGGQLVALLGRNGTGKSTLLRAIMGLESPQSGEINLQGKDIASLKPEKLALSISFVTTDKVRIANLRCKDVVALGRAPYTIWRGQLQPEDRKIVDNAIQLVGMSGYAEKTMDKMSDGECQRVMIARALAQDTPIILLDEPTNGLDITSRQALKRIISRSMDDESTLLISTHQAHDFENLLDHLVILGKGEILLNRSLDEISNRLLFARTDILPAESIYSEQDLSGHFSILPNEDGEENTPDIELLYKAVLQQPEKIKSMFQ